MTDDQRLTKQETCARLSISERTLHKHVKAGELEPTRWRPPGGHQWQTVFLVEDVDRLAAKLAGGAPTPFLVPPTAAAANGNGHRLALSQKSDTAGLPSGEDIVRAVFAMLQQMLTGQPALEGAQGPQAPQGPQVDRLFLTIREAAAVSGLPAADIRRACESGELKARQTGRGGWRIHVDELKAFR